MIQLEKMIICCTRRDLVPFVQFKKHENAHRGVLLLVVNSRFLNCTNGTKSRSASNMFKVNLKNSILTYVCVSGGEKYQFFAKFCVRTKVYSKLLIKAPKQHLSSLWCIFCELRTHSTNEPSVYAVDRDCLVELSRSSRSQESLKIS